MYILLTPDKEHKKDVHDISVVGFHNGKSLKDHLIRAKLPNVEITRRSESCEKGNCHVCDFICDTDTFSTKVCRKCGALNCNSQKVFYLLKCRLCGKAPYLGKAKTKFRVRLNNYKSARKYHSNIFMNIMTNTVIMGLTIESSH